ncbi:MAG: hypothetical protein CBC35_03355 [Planctomycetes bacterium TMED75]|nr:hypothetical protein [Planctomycetaceae bacterium]OUU94879.1 MAG: hypothetical protein CBC35_03355 [Planctomycetes bacterium TMED75]
MMKASLLTTTAVLAVASAASADFIGFDGTVEEVGEFTVIKMYAVYDAEDIGLNVYNAQIVTKDAGGFNQSDVQIGAGGTWAPNASLDIPGFADSAIDSFGTMGYGVGPLAATNGTALDPTFLDASGGLGAFVPSGGGWYNGNPTNEQVATTFAGGYDGLSGYGVWVGQFAFATSRVEAAGAVDFFIFDAEMGSKDAAGEVFFGGDAFIWAIPAPGALALLGLGGLAARRRRG